MGRLILDFVERPARSRHGQVWSDLGHDFGTRYRNCSNGRKQRRPRIFFSVELSSVMHAGDKSGSVAMVYIVLGIVAIIPSRSERKGRSDCTRSAEARGVCFRPVAPSTSCLDPSIKDSVHLQLLPGACCWRRSQQQMQRRKRSCWRETNRPKQTRRPSSKPQCPPHSRKRLGLDSKSHPLHRRR